MAETARPGSPVSNGWITVVLLGALGLVGIAYSSEIREYREKLLDSEFYHGNRSAYFPSSMRERPYRRSWGYSETREFLRYLEVPAGICLAISSLAALAIWTSRNLRAASQFDPALSKYPPRMSAMAWFVPLFNLIYPFEVVRNLWISIDRTLVRQGRRGDPNPWGLVLAVGYQAAALCGFGLLAARPLYAFYHAYQINNARRITMVSMEVWACIALVAMCFLALANVAMLSRLISTCVDGDRPSALSFTVLQAAARKLWETVRRFPVPN